MNTKRITILGLLGAGVLLSACHFANPDPRNATLFKVESDGYAGGRVTVYDRSSFEVLGEGYVRINKIAFLRNPALDADTFVYTMEYMCSRNLYREVGLKTWKVTETYNDEDPSDLSTNWGAPVSGSVDEKVMKAACTLPKDPIGVTPLAGDFPAVRKSILEELAR